MDETALVGRVERLRHLARDRDRASRLQPALAAQQRAQVGAVDEAHRDEKPTARLARLVDRDDVRVVERRGEPRLAEHPLAEPLVGAELEPEQLQRDRPGEGDVERTR